MAPMDISGRKSATLESENMCSAMAREKAARQKNAGKEKNAVTARTLLIFRFKAGVLPAARFAETNGTRFTEIALVKTAGKNKSGITMPDITPSISVASFLEKPYMVSIAGIKMFDADAKNVSAVFEQVTGTAVSSREEKHFLIGSLFIPFVTRRYEKNKIMRLNASPAKIPKVSTADERVISFLA